MRSQIINGVVNFISCGSILLNRITQAKSCFSFGQSKFLFCQEEINFLKMIYFLF